MTTEELIASLTEQVPKLEQSHRQMRRRLKVVEQRSIEEKYGITDEVIAECERREKAMREDPSRGLSLKEVKARIAARANRSK